MCGSRITPASHDTATGVLVSEGRADTVSDTFTVTTRPLRVVAFGLGEADSVTVHRVWHPAGSSSYDGCGNLTPRGEAFEQPHYVGGHRVILRAGKPEAVIDAAGEYRIVYEGDGRPDAQVVLLPDAILAVNNTDRGVA